MCPTRSFFLFRGASVPCPIPFSGLVRNAHFVPYIILASSVSFVFFPMSCSGQVTDFSFLSDVMPAPCCPSSFRCHALELYPSVVIVRLGKAPGAEHAHVSRPSPLPRHCEAWKSRIFRKFKTNSSSPSSSLRGLGKPKQSSLTIKPLYSPDSQVKPQNDERKEMSS